MAKPLEGGGLIRLSKRRQDVNNQGELGDSVVATTTFEAALDAFYPRRMRQAILR